MLYAAYNALHYLVLLVILLSACNSLCYLWCFMLPATPCTTISILLYLWYSTCITCNVLYYLRYPAKLYLCCHTYGDLGCYIYDDLHCYICNNLYYYIYYNLPCYTCNDLDYYTYTIWSIIIYTTTLMLLLSQ